MACNTAVMLASLLLALAAAASTPPPASDYAMLAGKVAIKTYGAHTIGIAVHDERGGWLHLFRLWSESSLAPLSVTLDEASIEFRGSEVVIMSETPRAFYVFGTTAAQSGAPRAPAGYDGAQYFGYGLNHEVRAARSRNSDEDPFEHEPGNGGGGTPSCSAGGVGSTSCTVTSGGNSCTASCASGYYACCNFGPLSCRCYRN